MRITTKGRYALRAITNLAASYDGKPRPIKTIAAEEGISPEFLEQIFFRLKKAEIIGSVRGPGGGFVLSRDPAEITVKDIFIAVDEGIDLTPCTACGDGSDEGMCERRDDCIIYPVWKEASEYILTYFENLTLRSILDTHSDRIYRLLKHARVTA